MVPRSFTVAIEFNWAASSTASCFADVALWDFPEALPTTSGDCISNKALKLSRYGHNAAF